MVTYNFIFHGDKSLKTYGNRDYGVAFALPLIIIEKILNLKDSREIYLMRHLVTHLFFLISAFVFYLLIYFLYKNRILGILGYLMLLLKSCDLCTFIFQSQRYSFHVYVYNLFLSCVKYHFKNGKPVIFYYLESAQDYLLI